MEEKITAEKRVLLTDVIYKFLNYLVNGFLVAYAPVLVTGVLGKVVGIILDKLLTAISEFGAKNDYYLSIDVETAFKIKGMNKALADLRNYAEAHDPEKPLTPGEKDANDKANSGIDDGVSWE